MNIEGYDGLYTITEAGVVTNTKTGKVIKHKLSHNGYAVVDLRLYGKRARFKVHRLVAMAFIPNTEETHTTVDHRDEDKLNNHVSNLRWCTQQMNMDYYWSARERAVKTIPQHTKEEYIAKVSKKVSINGINYSSVREAAQYIADTEGKNLDTIRKEIRNFTNGKRSAWSMYNKYYIAEAV